MPGNQLELHALGSYFCKTAPTNLENVLGTSFTSFKGFGFWSRDEHMAVWMANLVEKMDKFESLNSAQLEFRADLIRQASMQANGTLQDCLYHLSKSETLLGWAVARGQEALQSYLVAGEFLDGQWLNDLMHQKGSVAEGPQYSLVQFPSHAYISYGRKWLDLIEGKFSPLPPHPSGLFHGTGEIEIDVTQSGRGKIT